MPEPLLLSTDQPVFSTDSAGIALLIGDVATFPEAIAQYPGLAEALKAMGFSGAASSFSRVYLPALTSKMLAVVGLGKKPSLTNFREAAGVAVRSFTGVESLSLHSPITLEGSALAIAEGALMGTYRFSDYRSEEPKKRASTVTVCSDDLADADLVKVRVMAEAVSLVKNLVATPSEWLKPAELAEIARDKSTDLPIKVEVLDETALAEGGFGGLLAVGQGSDSPPRMVHLDYHPANATDHVALVGKGITFDTGGLSLKPAASMVGMKMDMAGAATVLAVIRAVAALELPIRVTAWMCLAENMPSGSAIRPGDVIRVLGGKTIEILNTDAEGRLVLADGLVSASRENPDVIIDVATLTGAIIVALGSRHTGVMGQEQAVSEYLSAATAADELAWALPLPEHMREDLESPIADLKNVKMGSPAGGSLFAGLFLEHFVGKAGEEADSDRIPWIHLDIAGSATNEGSGYGFTDPGPTGATVRSIIEFISRRAS